MIRVLLADDQALLRGAFKVLLASDADMEVVGEAADGEEAIRQLRVLRPDVVLIGFLLKECEPSELLQAVRVVARGEALLAPSVTRTLIAAFAAQPARQPVAPTALAELTDREREVMALVAAGRSHHEIAQALVITPATAKTHVSRAMAKLGVRDRAQLVVVAYETRLVTPGHQD